MRRDPELAAILRHAAVVELRMNAEQIAALARPPRAMLIPKGLRGRQRLRRALRAERRRSRKLLALLGN